MKTTRLLPFLLVTLCVNLPGPAQNSSFGQSAAAVELASDKPLLQQKLGHCDFSTFKTSSFGDLQVSTYPGGDVAIAGRDDSGRSWKATYKATPGAGCELWKVDLSRNGTQDLAFLEYGANGSGWDTTLSLLLFDRQGRPFPWQATSRFSVTDLGIRELVRLRSSRNPAVIVSSRQDKNSSAAGATDYDVFEFVGDRASEVAGRHGGRPWSANVAGELSHEHAQSFLSTNAPESNRVGVRFLSLRGTTDSERRLQLSDGTNLMTPKVLVVDTDNAGTIVSAPDKVDLLKLKSGSSIKGILGQDCDEGPCSPVVLWISAQ